MKKIIKFVAGNYFLLTLVCYLVYLYIYFIKFTSKIKETYPLDIEDINNNPAIYIFWHGRLLMISSYPPSKLKTYGLISDHSDGKLIARLVEFSNASPIFGSSNRNSTKALREILKILKFGGNSLMMTPDGPRGPAFQINGALIEIASITSIPIIPITFAAQRCKRFTSWDEFVFVYPFNRILFKIGDRIDVPPKLNKDEIENYKIKVANILNELTKQAEKEVSHV